MMGAQWTAHEALLLLTAYFFMFLGLFTGLGYVMSLTYEWLWKRVKKPCEPK